VRFRAAERLLAPTRPAVAALLLLLYLPSCTFWQATETPLPVLTESEHPPARVRVTTVEAVSYEIVDPRIHNDTLIGGTGADEHWIFLAVADITKVELRQKNFWKTVGIGAGIAALVAAVVVLCGDPDKCTSDDEEY